MDAAYNEMTVELLDILLGFAIGVNRQRAANFQQSPLGRIEISPEEQWIIELRAALVAELPRFWRLAASTDEDVAKFAGRIVRELCEGQADQTMTPVPFNSPLF